MNGLPQAITQMCIAEQLPESEKRDELIGQYREFVEQAEIRTGYGVNLQIMKQLIQEMLESKATIGEQARVQLDKIADQCLENLKDDTASLQELLVAMHGVVRN